jgi:hypothetical protein
MHYIDLWHCTDRLNYPTSPKVWLTILIFLLIVFDHVFVLFVIWIKKLIINKHQLHQKYNNKHSNFLYLWTVSIFHNEKNLWIILFLAATLSPVPEADDYESSELSLSDVVIRSSGASLNNSNKRHQQQQPLIKSERKRDLSHQVN